MNKRIIVSIFIVSILLTACGVTRKTSKPAKSAQSKLTNDSLSRKFDRFYYEGLDLKQQGHFDRAFESFRMSYAIDSLDAGLLAEMSGLYSAMGETATAMSFMEKACAIDASNWWYHIRLVSIYSDQKKFQEAILVMRKMLKLYPEKEESYQLLASMYKQSGEIDKAIEVYNGLEKITGIDETVSFEKFYLYAQQNKIKKAVVEIDRLIAKYPINSRYKVIRGDIYMQQKMPDQAFEIYKKVLETDPENPYIYLSLSEYYESEGQPEMATASIVKALKNPQLAVEEKIEILGQFVPNIIRDSTRLDETESLFKLLIEYYPLEEQVHGYYSIFLQYRGRTQEAVNELESMLNINPSNPQTWLQLIQIHLAEQKLEDVIQIADRAIEQIPNAPQWYFYKGISLFQQNKYAEALEVNKKGVDFVPENQAALKSDFYAQIGDLSYKLGQNKDAFIAYEEALKANPTNIYVMNNYAYYLSELKADLKKAEQMSAKTVEKEPSNSTFLDTYAWILYQQENYSLAKFYIERAVDNLKTEYDPGVIYDHYGDILWQSGLKEKALEMWQKAVESGFKTDELKEKLEKKGM